MKSFDDDFCPEPRLPSGKSGCAGMPTPNSWAAFTTLFSVIYYLGCVFGAYAASEVNDRLGRRASVFAASAAFAAGTAVCCCAPSGAIGRTVVLIARVAAGVGVGAASFSLPIYAAEAAPEHQRGLLSGMMQLTVVVGLLVAGIANRLLLATPFGWRISLGLALIPPLALLAGVSFVPESPRWLLRNKGRAAARASLLRLRGDGSRSGRCARCASAHAPFDEAGAMAAAAAALDAEVDAMVDALAAEARSALVERGGGDGAGAVASQRHALLVSDGGGSDDEERGEDASGSESAEGAYDVVDLAGSERSSRASSVAPLDAAASPRASSENATLGGALGGPLRAPASRRCCGRACCGASSDDAQARATYCDVFRPRTRKRALIAMGVMVGQQFSGINPILVYGGLIFQGVTGDGALALCLLYGVNAVVTLPALLLVDRVGRRFLLLLGSCGMFVGLVASGSLFAFGCVSTLDADGGEAVECNDTIAALMVASTCLFVAMFGVSWGPVSWIYPAEIFPLATRSRAVSLSTMTNWTAGIVTMGVQLLFPLLTVPGTFFLFAALCAAGGAFTFFFCPETKGVPLEQIESVFTSFRPCAKQGGAIGDAPCSRRGAPPPLSEQLCDDDDGADAE